MSSVEDYAIEVKWGEVLRPVMVRLADEGVPTSCISRSMGVPLPAVNETIAAALANAHILETPPADWPPGQPASERCGHRSYSKGELIIALQHLLGITHQQALLLSVLIKKPRATKDVLHAAAQSISERPSKPKLIDVVIHKLRMRMQRHGYRIMTIWGGGYYLYPEDRKAILDAIGLSMPAVEPPHGLGRARIG